MELTQAGWWEGTATPLRPDLQVEALAQGFDETMTWKQASAGTPWASPGGHVHDGVLDVAPGTTDFVQDEVVTWYPTHAVQRWLDGDWDNHGLRVARAAGETRESDVSFYSRQHPDVDVRPRLVVEWQPQVGVVESSPVELDLGGVGTARVDVASGNLMVQTVDATLAGTAGMDLDFLRTYNHLQGPAHLGFGSG